MTKIESKIETKSKNYYVEDTFEEIIASEVEGGYYKVSYYPIKHDGLNFKDSYVMSDKSEIIYIPKKEVLCIKKTKKW